jgi:uncharacterized repeat protein (TIGR03847 family)
LSRIIYKHTEVNRCVVGTVGEPGERAFFLQVSSFIGTNCVAIEKSQLIALVERLRMLIRELRRNQMTSLEYLNLPAVKDDAPLEYPIMEDFRAGVIAISYEQGSQTIDLQLQAISEEEEFSELIDLDSQSSYESAELPDLLVASLTIAQVRGFCERAKYFIAAGRTPCPFCGNAVGNDGHLCPRANGYRR